MWPDFSTAGVARRGMIPVGAGSEPGITQIVMSTSLSGARILPAPLSRRRPAPGPGRHRHASSERQPARREGISGLRRYNRDGKLVGTALTVKTRPGDNLMIYKAMMMVEPVTCWWWMRAVICPTRYWARS